MESVVLEEAAFLLLEQVVWVWPLAGRSSLTGVTDYRRPGPSCLYYLPSCCVKPSNKSNFFFKEAKEFEGVGHLGRS